MNDLVNFFKERGNISVTENGATGYATTGHPLLDCNFAVSSFRSAEEIEIYGRFLLAYDEDPILAIKWLFYLRDIRGGLGERRSFRVILKWMIFSAVNQKRYPEFDDIIAELIDNIPEMGRWDDLVEIAVLDIFYKGSSRAVSAALAKIEHQFKADLNNARIQPPEKSAISLLAKWMPSINTSSADTREKAAVLCKLLRMSHKEYRKALALLRRKLPIVETSMSANKWEEIEYDNIGAKANINYNSAFYRHTEGKRRQYIIDCINGNGKMNIGGIVPYEIYHRYNINKSNPNEIFFCNALWDKLVKDGYKNDYGFKDAIVVCDGSYSMTSLVNGGNSSVQAIEVARSLAIYFASQLEGPLKDKVIEFSKYPKFIDLSSGTSLSEKFTIMSQYTDCSNTDIKAVFDLLLEFAISEGIDREKMPKQIIIVSDMEFDRACSNTDAHYLEFVNDKHSFINNIPGLSHTKFINQTKLFDEIRMEYWRAGYELPKLIFWNVCSKTGTIPDIANDDHPVVLISGFSQNAMKVNTSEKADPYEALVEILSGNRYAFVDVIADLVK